MLFQRLILGLIEVHANKKGGVMVTGYSLLMNNSLGISYAISFALKSCNERWVYFDRIKAACLGRCRPMGRGAHPVHVTVLNSFLLSLQLMWQSAVMASRQGILAVCVPHNDSQTTYSPIEASSCNIRGFPLPIVPWVVFAVRSVWLSH